VRDLTVRTPGGAVLVENASFDVSGGELLLLVGPSGSGKTSIVNVLCGLIDRDRDDWQISGTLACAGRAVDLATARSDLCGLVVQGNALFDDLSASENLRIAADHAAEVGEFSDEMATLLGDIDPSEPVAM